MAGDRFGGDREELVDLADAAAATVLIVEPECVSQTIGIQGARARGTADILFGQGLAEAKKHTTIMIIVLN
jgi:hypothetical protein